MDFVKIAIFQLTWKCGKQRPTLPGRVPVSGRDTWNICNYSNSNLVEDQEQTIVLVASVHYQYFLQNISCHKLEYLLIVIQVKYKVTTNRLRSTGFTAPEKLLDGYEIYLLIYVFNQNINLRAWTNVFFWGKSSLSIFGVGYCTCIGKSRERK